MPTASVLEFTSANGGKRKTTKADEVPIKLDGTEFTLIVPKTSTLAMMTQLMAGDEDKTAEELGQALLQATGMLIGCFKRPGRAIIERRLADPDDSLDIEDLLPIITVVVDKAFGRPTGSRPATSTPPRRRSTSSRVTTPRTRAKG